MTKETQSTTVSATASQADVTDVVPATEGENASAAQPDVIRLFLTCRARWCQYEGDSDKSP